MKYSKLKYIFFKLVYAIPFAFTILFFLLNTTVVTKAQETLSTRLGVFGHYDYNLHSTFFDTVPGVPNRFPSLDKGTGSGFSVGLLFEIPLSKYFLLGFRGGFQADKSTFTKNDSTPVIFNQTLMPGNSEYTLNAKLYDINFSPMLSYRPFGGLLLSVGGQVGKFIVKDYDEKEVITNPATGAVYPLLNSNIKNVNNGAMQNLSVINATAIGGISYEIPLNSSGSILLVPEVFYTYNFLNIINDSYWKANNYKWKRSTISGGISLKYVFSGKKKFNRTDYLIDTIQKQSNEFKKKTLVPGIPSTRNYIKEQGDSTLYIEEVLRTDTLFSLMPANPLTADLNIYGITKFDEKVLINEMYLKVSLAKDVYPILPYIFFDNNLKKLPDRYIQTANNEDFNTSTIGHNPIDFHRNNLNILALRMKANPNAKIKLTGYIDPITEPNYCKLAENRAKEIKDYLVNNCGIDEKRIDVVPRPSNCYPPAYGWRKSEDGCAENRRVEISVSNPALLAPVAGEKYEEVEEVLPVSYEFAPVVNKPDEINKWNITASQSRNNIFDTSGTGAPQPVPYNLLSNDIRKINPDVPLTMTLNVTDNSGNTTTANKVLTFVKDTSDYEIERLTLALFNISDYTLDKRMKNDINNFLHGLDTSSTISIFGYTDSLGTASENLQLSEMRAKEVKNFIMSIAPKAKIERVEGVASKHFAPGIFSYQTQEERFLSRTVEIVIKKKR